MFGGVLQAGARRSTAARPGPDGRRARALSGRARRGLPVATALLAACAALAAAPIAAGASGRAEHQVSRAKLAKLSATVKAAEKVPAFVSPGPAINVGSLKGSKMVVMPSSSAISYCAGIASDSVAIGKSLGIAVTNVSTAGQVSQWQSGALQAATLGAKAMALICGIPPSVMTPQLKVLKAHHVASVFDQAVDLGSPLKNPSMPGGSYATGIPEARAMRILVDQAIVEHHGKPFDSILLTSSDIFIEPGVLAATKDELRKECGRACSFTVVNIPIADWGTRVQSSVASALAKDPKIKAVLTLFDGMDEGALPAVESAHRPGLKIYAWGAGEGILKLEETSAHGLIAGDIGCGASWAAYALMDQMLRVGSHHAPAAATKEYCRPRLFTPANVRQFFSKTGGFGNGFVTGYKKLWRS